jgi:anti-sigma regulatory factor (Ser/Thr protein kinase)
MTAQASGDDQCGELATRLFWSFPAGALHARMARKWLMALLDVEWPDEDSAFNAVQTFAEVVANAIEHGEPPVTVGLLVTDDRLLCEISDSSTRLPVAQFASAEDERHRGLPLVRTLLGGDLAVRPTIFGKTVSFSLAAKPDLA